MTRAMKFNLEIPRDSPAQALLGIGSSVFQGLGEQLAELMFLHRVSPPQLTYASPTRSHTFLASSRRKPHPQPLS